MTMTSHTISPVKGHLLPDEEKRACLTHLHQFILRDSVALVFLLNQKEDLFLFPFSQTGILK